MYITNPEKIKSKYKCNKRMADYLINECKIPILSIDGDDYYFSYTVRLRSKLEEFENDN